MPEQLDPLRQAAVTLLTAAPAGAVLLAVRALLDGWEQNSTPAISTTPLQAAGRTKGAISTATPAPLPPAVVGPTRPNGTVKTRTATSDGVGAAACEQLRQQVREAREARGLTVRALADELGVANGTLKLALYGQQPPSRPLQQRLADWLVSAPEVAAAAAEPFHGNEAGHTDTSDDTDRLAA
jgi:hypothetical protein